MTVKLTLSRILTLVVAFCIYFTAQAQIVPGAIPCDRLAVQQAENPAQSFPNGLLSISTDPVYNITFDSADNFTVPAGECWTITRMSFVYFLQTYTLNNPTEFTMSALLYNDNGTGNLPTDPYSSYANSFAGSHVAIVSDNLANLEMEDAGPMTFGYNIRRIIIDLSDNPLYLCGGNYWVSPDLASFPGYFAYWGIDNSGDMGTDGKGAFANTWFGTGVWESDDSQLGPNTDFVFDITRYCDCRFDGGVYADIIDVSNNSNSGTFSNTTSLVQISGLFPPFTMNWYTYGDVTHNDNAGSNNGTQFMTVTYGTDAMWSVTISDMLGCDTVVTNVPTGNASDSTHAVVLNWISDDDCKDLAGTGEISIMGWGGSGAFDYAWWGPSGYTSTGSGTISGLNSGWYCVDVTDSGTGHVFSDCYWVDCTNNGGDNGGDRFKTENQTLINLSPNPVTDIANITFGASADGKANVSIYTVDGKKVATVFDGNVYAGQATNITYNTNHLSNGMYFVSIQHEDGTVSQQKMMVK